MLGLFIKKKSFLNDRDISALIYSFVSVFEKAIALLMLAWLARVVSPEAISEYSMVILLAGFLKIIVDYGQESRLRVELNRDNSNSKYELIRSFQVSAVVFFIVAITVLIIRNNSFDVLGVDDRWVLFSLGYLLVLYLYSLIRGLMVTLRKVKKYVVVTAISIVSDLSIFVFLIVGFDSVNDIESRMIALLLGPLIAVLYIMINYAFNSLKGYWKDIFIIDFSAWRFGTNMVLNGFFVVGLLYIERNIFISHDKVDFVGYLYIAFSSLAPVLIMLESLSKSYISWFYKKMNSGKAYNEVNKAIFRLLGISLIGCASCSLAMFFLVPIIFGSQYSSSAFLIMVSILCFFPFFKAISQVNGRYLIFYNKEFLLPVISAFTVSSYWIVVFYRVDKIDFIEYAFIHLGFYSVQALIVWCVALYVRNRYEKLS